MIFRALLVVLLGCTVSSAGTIQIPKDHFLGISEPCPSISVARESAFHQVAKQILRTIGGEYTINFESLVSLEDQSYSQSATENFRYSLSGFLSEIERNMVSISYEKNKNGVVCQMLVHMAPRKLKRLQRLSMGPKILLTNLGRGIFEIREVNSVGVIITEFKITVKEKRRHANLLTLFVVKVLPENIREIIGSLPEPVSLSGGSCTKVHLPLPYHSDSIVDLVFGTKRNVRISLFGKDEVGREFRMEPVIFF